MDDEIDLREILLMLWKNRFTIIVVGLCSLGFSAAYAYLIAKPVFVSSALLIPTQSTNSTSELGAAAALLGGKKNGSADVDLYQSLLTSRTVIHKLLETPIINISDTAKGGIETLFQILKIDPNDPIQVELAFFNLSKAVSVGSKESGAGGILKVAFYAGSPWLAQQIGNNLLRIGQEELRLVRQERADVVMSSLQVAVSQAKREWDSTSKILAYFKDRNRSISLPEQMLQAYQLEMEKATKEQKYLLARKEYEVQMLEKAKAAPPMMILDSANLPAAKSKPKRTLIMALGLVVGVLGSCIWLLGVKVFLKTNSPTL